MSKMDDLRAMREARYEQGAARAAAKPQAASKRADRLVPRPAEAEPPTAAAAPAVQLCGHRAISGRTCTREHGHAARSHRYS
jgi:cytochrome c5